MGLVHRRQLIGLSQPLTDIFRQLLGLSRHRIDFLVAIKTDKAAPSFGEHIAMLRLGMSKGVFDIRD
ncbi:MAG: hypothetical protein AAF509_14435 [Pseudomonadota bacterium]